MWINSMKRDANCSPTPFQKAQELFGAVTCSELGSWGYLGSMCWGCWCYHWLWGLAGMELPFIVACLVLCFRCVTKTMLVCYTVLHCVLAAAEEILQSVRACSVSHSASSLNKIGKMQEFVRGCRQAGTQTNQRDIPCHTTPHWQWDGEEQGLNRFCSGAGCASVCLWEVVSDCLCITCFAFCLFFFYFSFTY